MESKKVTDELSRNKLFLKKLNNIIYENIKDESFSVSDLASQIGLSRSQLHRKVNKLYKISVSKLIRNIRLEEATKLLLNDSGSVSEIAYNVGFNSPSYFSKCFHEHFGYPPGEVKEYFSKDIENTNFFNPVQQSVFVKKSVRKIAFGNKTLLVLITTTVIVILFGFLYRNNLRNNIFRNNRQLISNKSIAVLPFKNLSEDISNQYFADGMMDDILNHLSSIKSFKVISRTSSEKYRKSDKSLPQIAKELGVSYIIEGSVQKYKNDIKIIIQLNDFNDEHIWADSFESEFKDIFKIQSDIAKKISSVLKTTLSPKEIEQIDKIHSSNIEAYNLYLQGLYFWNLRGEDNINRSIDFFNQSLAIDSNYSFAYLGLADAYNIIAYYGYLPKKEAYLKSKKYALKALSLDNKLAEAHATLGSIATYYERDWDVAEKELLMAITLKPNYATAHQWYSEYLDIMGRRDEARKHIDLALNLNPFSGIANWLSTFYFYREGNYKMVITRKSGIRHEWTTANSYIKLGMDLEAINVFQQLIEKDTPEKEYIQLSDIYRKSGIEGVIRSLIDWNDAKEDTWYYRGATLCAFIGEKEAALDNLEIVFKKGRSAFLRVKYDPDFESIRNHPRFVAMLREMNMEDQ